MSKSYKKTPILKGGGWGSKNFANRKVRRSQIVISNGKAYKKLYNTYAVNDYVFMRTRKEMLKRHYSDQKRADLGTWRRPLYKGVPLEEAIDQWERWYYRK